VTELLFVPIDEFRRVRALSGPTRAALFASLVRINTLYMIARAGSGHIGTSFSSTDIVAWLYLDVLGPDDTYFSSKGHDVPALYATLIGLERLPFEKLHELRRHGGLPGHPDVGTSGIAANTGSLGMGISKAKGMAIANRLQKRPGRVVVMTGDGELQEGQFWESLPSAVHEQLTGLTVVIDHNKIQSDTWVAKVSDLGDLEAKLRAFGWNVARCDGHDFASLARVWQGPGPRIVIADTIKGKGVSFMEQIPAGQTLYKFHSGAPDDDTYARASKELVDHATRLFREVSLDGPRIERGPAREKRRQPVVQRLVPAYSKALVREAEREPRIVALDADLVLDTGLIPFSEKFPDRFVECGIAEQDMVSQAGGFALKGMIPFAHSFACFLSSRPNEQIYTNATERTKVVYVGSLAGLLPGGPGHSHQCVRDLSSLGAVPGLSLIAPSCEREVELAVEYCARSPESCYLRLESIPVPVPYELPADARLEPGRGTVLRDGRDAVVIGYGPVLLTQAHQALDTLGMSIKLVNLPWLNRVDRAWLAETLGEARWLFTLDNHYRAGGQGEMLCAAVAELGRALRVRRFAVESIPLSGQNDEILKAHGLDADALGAGILAAVRGA
jgi:transketolase